MATSKVYFTNEISPEALKRTFDALNAQLPGKTAVKISTGEAGNPYFLDPDLIAGLVKELDGTIVECNTAYPGKRDTTDAHWKTIEEHGFTRIAPCDILDEAGEMTLPVGEGAYHIHDNIVGAHLAEYDSVLMLSHFKGHPMGGFGGALKNMAIGLASSRGKMKIHTSGNPDGTFEDLMAGDHDSFLESMADACKSIIDYVKPENIVYMNIANNLSVDCDCVDNPEAPEMANIGIFASTDPVAIDQACVDAVYNSDDPGKAALIERIESRNGVHTIEAACQLGLGSRDYEIVNV